MYCQSGKRSRSGGPKAGAWAARTNRLDLSRTNGAKTSESLPGASAASKQILRGLTRGFFHLTSWTAMMTLCDLWSGYAAPRVYPTRRFRGGCRWS